MLALRIYLLSGLILHKGVWEILKRAGKIAVEGNESSSTPKVDPVTTPRGIALQLVKAVKITILAGIALQTLLPEILPITSEPFVLRVLGALLYTTGLFIAIRGRLELGTNWSDIESARIFGDQAVVAKGLYRFIRHPIYVGDLLLLLGLELSLNSWLVLGAVLLAPVVLWQAVREEKKLSRALPGYQEYCAQTKRFIPFVV
jgi:protein-S-isoprenylcysteine O-methyltransferase Ste14